MNQEQTRNRQGRDEVEHNGKCPDRVRAPAGAKPPIRQTSSRPSCGGGSCNRRRLGLPVPEEGAGHCVPDCAQTVPRLYFVRLTDHEHHQASCQPGTCTGCTRPAGATTVQFKQLETGAPTHAARLCLKPLNLCLETATMEPVSVHIVPSCAHNPPPAMPMMPCAVSTPSSSCPSKRPVPYLLCPDSV